MRNITNFYRLVLKFNTYNETKYVMFIALFIDMLMDSVGPDAYRKHFNSVPSV